MDASTHDMSDQASHALFESSGLGALIIEDDLSASAVNTAFLNVFGGRCGRRGMRP